MMEVSVTTTIRSSVELLLENKATINTDDFNKVKSIKLEEKTIPFSLLQTVSKCLQELQVSNQLPSPASPIWVHELIKGSQVIVPSIAEKIETPETIERRKKLEAYVNNLRYKKMVKNISSSQEEQDLQDKAEMADFKSQAGMGLNVVVATGVALGIGFYIGRRTFQSDVGGIILGLVFMIGALIVETLLFSIRLSKVDMKKDRLMKQNLVREATEKENGGFNMTPHLLSLPRDSKTQSYSLDGKELVSLPKDIVPFDNNNNTDNAIINLPKNKKKGKK